MRMAGLPCIIVEGLGLGLMHIESGADALALRGGYRGSNRGTGGF
jgi:hypothetical protein